jgi:hypothetical protein
MSTADSPTRSRRQAARVAPKKSLKNNSKSKSFFHSDLIQTFLSLLVYLLISPLRIHLFQNYSYEFTPFTSLLHLHARV